MTLAVVCRREFASLWHSNDNVAPIAGPAWEFLLRLLRELLNKIIIILIITIIIIIRRRRRRRMKKKVKRLKNIRTWREKLEDYGGLGIWSSTGSQFAALGVVNKRLDAWLEKLGVTIRIRLLQKIALLGTARILRKLLQSWRRRNDTKDLWPLAMAHSFQLV